MRRTTNRVHAFFSLLFVTTLLAGAFLAAPSLAQLGPHGPHGMHGGGHHGPGPFFGADADGDGAVSRAELDAILSSIDADDDGVLAIDELRAHHQELRQADAEDAPSDARPSRRGPRQRMMRHVLHQRMMGLDADDDGEITVAEVQAHFDELDENGDGMVSADERPCPRCGMHQRLLGFAALKGADADGNREVTLSEWNAFLATVDTDGDGEVSVSELRERAHADREPPSVTLDELNATFDRLDENGDGVVTADELPRRPHHRGPGR